MGLGELDLLYLERGPEPLEHGSSHAHGRTIAETHRTTLSPIPSGATPPHPSSLRERQRERTRAALLAAAERRFAAQGYHGATVEDLAADAEVSVSSLYNYFPGGKRELYLAVVELAVEANRRYLEQAWDPQLSALEQILAAADAYLLFHLDHPGFFQMVAIPQLSSRPDDDQDGVSERIAQRVEAEVGKLRTAIAEGVGKGELQSVDPARAATFLWGAWNGVIALSTRPDRLRLDDEEIRAVLELGRRLVLEGLAPPGVRVSSGRLSRRVRFTTARRPDGDGPRDPLTR